MTEIIRLQKALDFEWKAVADCLPLVITDQITNFKSC